MSETNTPLRHDVRSDKAGFNGRYDRLTCYTKECNGATLVAQPWMSQEVFNRKIDEFLAQHPCPREKIQKIP